MLKLIDITKEYVVDKDEEKVLALNKVSIEFRKNEFVSILGPSGCGKTTLLNIIGGLDRYTSGDIQIEGVSTKDYDDVDWDTYRNRRIGFVFQSYNLIPHMNILKNVAMSLTLAGVEKEERKRRALEALEKVGLASQARKKPNQLSGGQMQRVAIARALVNNPEIILADEPTGALDSESGIQVMDLLKEVAQDRLVVMVTHNPSLAEEYSTRIVYLKDGEVVGDSMPYDSSEEVENPCASAGEDGVSVIDENEVDSACNADASKKEAPRKKSFKERFLKYKKADKCSMKLSTAINLSWNNLLAKKGRTLLTSIAGSIGIIGIILVLSLSNGAAKYVRGLEESALSTYPLTIGQTNTDPSAILQMLMTPEEERPSNPNTDEIYTAKMLGKVVSQLGTLLAKNDLVQLKKYIDENFDDSLATVKYNYGVSFNAFIEDPNNANLVEKYKQANPEATDEEAKAAAERYMKVSPYTDTMNKVLDMLPDNIKNMPLGGSTLNDMLNMFTKSGSTMVNSWAEMSSNQKLLESQYELVGENSRWPSSATEIVVVVDKSNQLLDYQLFMLGLQSEDDVIKAIMDSHWADYTTSVEELLSLEYKLLADADYLEEDEEEKWVDTDGDGVKDMTWTGHNHAEQNKKWIDDRDPVTVKVVGVIRPKEGVSVTSIGGVIGYTSALNELLIERASNHDAVVRMNELKALAEEDLDDSYKSPINFDYSTTNGTQVKLLAGDKIEFSEANNTDLTVMRKLGVANLEEPVSIEFYCSSFEAKEKIVAFIDKYNAETGASVSYGDSLSTIMSFVNTMVTTITGVLVAFAAISLIVSTIMIAIIIYTSVLERRKEIGVLRSIGARKKDISRVFLAESAILGGYSGLIGIIISVMFSFAGSAILKAVFKISGLMSISWWQCLIMFAISILLSMFAGFIPSRIAANKDPAIALRSE
ncbi:MAG: ATP-binding cassette domain-containing protein [Christensenellales bacterium]